MLIELRIRDFAVIDDLALELAPGLNALSGETGAGKSIIVGALSLLLGERASSEVVRSGAERAVVEGVFDVSGNDEVARRMEAAGVRPEEGLLILKREVAAEGRNRAWVNGSPATATLVGELGSSLVDLHGQHEHQTLLRPDEQRALLDAFAGAEERAGRVRALHGESRRLLSELDERRARRGELEARADFLRFQLGEIEGAELEEGEEEALEDEARKLENAEELAREASALHEKLYAGDRAVADRTAAARDVLRRLSRLDPALEEEAGMMEEAYQVLREVGRRMADYGAGVEHDPTRLEALRERQDRLVRLKRKYGPELSDVIETGRRVRSELDELEGAEVALEDAEQRLDRAREELRQESAELARVRAEAAARLEAAVQELLPPLGMAGGRFEIELRRLDEPGAGGAERVEFLVSLNPGFDPRPLARVASGGELSRVMLALKTVLARVDRVPTLVFDEIDAGIGGVVAGSVAEKLARVSANHQVFVITHLPQLASRADHHLFVEKRSRRGLASTSVAELIGEDRVREIARMLGGDPESNASRDHARELLGV